LTKLRQVMMSLAKGERLSTTSTLDDNLLIAIG